MLPIRIRSYSSIKQYLYLSNHQLITPTATTVQQLWEHDYWPMSELYLNIQTKGQNIFTYLIILSINYKFC